MKANSKLKNKIYISTSGWVYKHWKNTFYPPNLSEKEYLKYYSQHFSTVEVNNSFYHLLNEASVQNWIKSVPKDFVFSIKASRYITHMKKLIDPEKTTKNFFESIKPFKNKIGAILFQLPPKFDFNPERLENLFKTIPDNYKYAFEFRDKRWFNNETYDILRKNNAALCIYNLGEFQTPKEITTDFTYIRFHGPGIPYANKYSEEQLNDFSNDIINYNKKAKTVFGYFNNDEAGYAIENANELKQKLGLF